MGYEQSVLRRATARLEAQRKVREEAQERLRSEIYAKLPRVAAIDRELPCGTAAIRCPPSG